MKIVEITEIMNERDIADAISKWIVVNRPRKDYEKWDQGNINIKTDEPSFNSITVKITLTTNE